MYRLDSRVRSKSVNSTEVRVCVVTILARRRSIWFLSALQAEQACVHPELVERPVMAILFQALLMSNLLVPLAYQILAARNGLAQPAISDWLRQGRVRSPQRSAAPGCGAGRLG
jgi:hypothetical protein